MKNIFKYKIETTDYQLLKLPKGSRMLSAEEQHGGIVVYALVDTDVSAIEAYSIKIHGTGHLADDVDDYVFIGTVKLEGGQFMFHVFYKLN